MRIEDIDKTRLFKAGDKELLILKLRFTQLWDKNFKDNITAVVGSLNRNKFLKSYKMLLNEMNSRHIEKSTSDIDKATFRKAMTANRFGIDVSDFEDVVVTSNCIVVDAADALGIDLKEVAAIIKVKREEIVEIFEEAQDKLNKAYIPIYDLVLRAKSDTVQIEIAKPYPNEHSARLQDPGKFDSKSFRRTTGGTIYGSKKVPSTIAIIWGKLKGKAKPSDPPMPQALRFPTKNWTSIKAKKWLSDNGIKFISFESAKKVTKKIWGTKYIKNLSDSAFLFVEKDEEDNETKTRYFPYMDNEGKIDLVRLQNASMQITKSDLFEDVKIELQAKAEKILEDIKEGKKFEKYISVYLVDIDKADKEEHIICGIVYEPNVEDAQGDKANEVEIRKAAYQFMEEVQVFKVMHKGRKIKTNVLESYIAPTDFTVANQVIKKGSWVLTIRVLDKKIWKAVKDGKLTGFSMAGYARADS